MDTQKKDNDKAGLDSTLSKGMVPNVGTGPLCRYLFFEYP